MRDAGMEQPLKAYQVGGNDIVAAGSREEALAVLEELAGQTDLTVGDVAPIAEDELDVPVVDEEGNPCPSIRQMLAELSEPAYLFGWD
ncbi:hypothetical protein [Chromobacterium sphagni]|uniref:Uncharacterized protein n=1 Tax=Chromobacterium sphagni TaxID=1903179 RepID=A0A1S1WVK2_9NEIS|nr:hypothetical protein [Chromobacterium sphagni]OHX11314.1 hypothetical protein BI347_16660 [Chromobacterium sphagni]OHX19009.1 hypothetical protein BI344_10345 [Chromobacterium sphagni]